MATLGRAEEIRVRELGFFRSNGEYTFSGRVITVNGRLNSRQLRRIADAAEKYGNGEVLMTTRLTFECPGIPYENIEPFISYISEEGMETGGFGKRVKPVISCKGTKCKYGLIDTYDISEDIHHEIYMKYRNVDLPHKFKIAVGGCPNNCVKPDLNDLGIIGWYVPKLNRDKCRGCQKCAIERVCPAEAVYFEDDKAIINHDKCISCGRCRLKCPFKAVETKKTGYKICIGGMRGKKIVPGRMLNEIFTTKEEVVKVIERAILVFRENGVSGERFASTIEREGIDKIEKELVSNDILLRKEEILAKKIKK